MNRRFVEAVIATFRQGDRDICGADLHRIDTRDWRRGWHWLDASGLALYFRQQVATLGLEAYIPADILSALDRRLQDNKQRTVQLFKEFQAINSAFQKSGLHYVNLKGFTLIPDYCPDPALRCQFDLDFMVPQSERGLCEATLESRGYAVTGKHGNVIEFKAGSDQVPSIRYLYKSRSQRSVEVHLVCPSKADLPVDADVIFRRQDRICNGVVFPVLSDVDLFLAQAEHLLRHLRSEWTRISWLLEFRTFVNSRVEDTRLWQDVRNLATVNPDAALAVGVAVVLATQAFGDFAPSELLGWSIEAVPGSTRLWLDHYGETVLRSDFPGTKLYLLLDGELSNSEGVRKATLAKLFPIHRPPRITYSDGRRSLRASLSQIWFGLFRLRFHIIEGSRYVMAACQWRRITSGQSG